MSTLDDDLDNVPNDMIVRERPWTYSEGTMVHMYYLAGGPLKVISLGRLIELRNERKTYPQIFRMVKESISRDLA